MQPPPKQRDCPQESTTDRSPTHPQLDPDQVWADARSHLRLALPHDHLAIWIDEIRPRSAGDGTLVLEAPEPIREWIRRRFGRSLEAAAAAAHPSLTRVEVVPPSPGGGTTAEPERASGPSTCARHSFDEFVMGEGNRLAHAAALAVAEQPGHAYNPLFLSGPAGVGKTHLLHAIANYVASHDARLRACLTNADAFTTSFTTAVRSGRSEPFKQLHRSADILLIDDLHLFEGRQKTSEELLHTIDTLVARGAQVVVASDRSPAAISGLDPRLLNRLRAGLVVEVEPPEYETRLAILQRKGLGDTATVEFLAAALPPNVRSLEGALIRTRAFASLTEQDITPCLAEKVISALDPSSAVPGTGPTIDQIQEAAAAALDLGREDLCSPKRNRRVVYARQIAMYLARELTSASLPTIGASFGGRDHTTVLHAHRRIQEAVLADASTRQVVDKLTRALTTALAP